MSQNQRQYFLVGATAYEIDGAKVDCYPEFISKGIWEMYYGSGQMPKYDERLKQIQPGDRIAIKTMAGRGSEDIYIRAIGVVKHIQGTLVVVDWKLTGLNRKVESKGCYGTIHGPYLKDNWIRKVFSL